MNANIETRPVERFFAAYSDDHRNATNQWLHVLCVPAIVWSLLAMLYVVPVPGLPIGTLAAVSTLVSVIFWLWLSLPLGLGMVAIMWASFAFTGSLQESLGSQGLLYWGVGVFVLAWIGQFIGHHIEGKRPSFFTDLVYLMIGPVWVLSKAYRRLSLPI
jgi:uncharacterized membrane protein YGL010W